MAPIHLILMGVAGCGKSTVARGLQDRLGWTYAEGDDFHPEANVAKTAAGTPLSDDDRWPWLGSIADWTTTKSEHGQDTIVTCSALKRAYRDVLRNVPGRTIFVHLSGTAEHIGERMSARTDHFMPTSLLPSQFATLEPLGADEDGIVVDVNASVEELIDQIVTRLSLEAPSQHPGAES